MAILSTIIEFIEIFDKVPLKVNLALVLSCIPSIRLCHSVSQLEWILQKKIIPYIDNTSVLKQLNDKLPENILWDDISDNLKGNHVFHESCHAVSRSLINEFYKDPVLKTKNDFQNHTLMRLIEESFANTCELLRCR